MSRWLCAVLAAAAVGITACGQISTTHHRPNPAPAGGTRTAAPAGVLLTMTVADGTVSPAPGRLEVKRGERVRLSVTSDVADEVHVHGFDVTRRLLPGDPVVVQFDAGRAGVFDVETHDQHLLLTQVAVR